MPYSEWSMQYAAWQRIQPHWRKFKPYVVHRRNLFLVMGENEDQLFKHAAAVMFAVQTKPWRLEIDLWKSFVNVAFEFLKGLDERWLE